MKKTEKKRPGRPARAETVRQTVVYFPEQVYEDLRVAVFEERQTISGYVTQAIERELKKRKGAT